MSTSHTGYATLGDAATKLFVPRVTLPIVFVPGFMGSRLFNPEKKSLAWNPLGFPFGDSPELFAVDLPQLTDLASPLEPPDDPRSLTYSRYRQLAARVPYLSELVVDFYGPLLQDLADLHQDGELRDAHGRSKVFCCGYDWRQDLALSAQRLASRVEEALRLTRAEKVILVCHSMGGLVARYYARVLGGEGRIHRMVLLGCPYLGAPMAYLQLKNGLPGSVAADFASRNTEVTTQFAAASDRIGTLASTLSAITSGQNAVNVLQNFLGEVYPLLCLSSFRLLSREETRGFLRQLPALFQLLPNAVYCATVQNWLVFDPLGTGYPAVGSVLSIPSLQEMAEFLARAVAAAAAGETVALDRPMARSPEQVQVVTLEEFWLRLTHDLDVIQQWAGGGSPPPAETHLNVGAALNDLVGLIKLVMARVQGLLLHNGNAPKLYQDIFTGLLDVISLRPVSAGNLVLATRLDQALTVQYNPAFAGDPGFFQNLITGVQQQLLRYPPLLALQAGLGGRSYDTVSAEREAQIRAADAQAQEDHATLEDRAPKVYVHPASVNFYGSHTPVPAGAILMADGLVSLFDANYVPYTLFPNLGNTLRAFQQQLGASARLPTREAQPQPGPDGQDPTITGDGAIPSLSANPPEAMLSSPFLRVQHFPAVQHSDLARDAGVRRAVCEAVQAAVPSFVTLP